MVDLTQFQEGINAAMNSSVSVCQDPKSEFASLLISDGMVGLKGIVVGKLERLDYADEKRGKKSGWYSYEEIEDQYNDGAVIGIGCFGDWRTGDWRTWSSRSESKMSKNERLEYLAAREAIRAQREADELLRQQEAAEKAVHIWTNAPACSQHQYLTNKGVGSTVGIKQANNGALIIPIAVGNEITSLQYIFPDGKKRFLSGGKIKGGYFLIQGETDVIYIAEGYSTGKSVSQATGKTVYIAFNAGNLYEVASYVKSKCTGRIVLAGDDDAGSLRNAGRTKAEQTASGLGIEAIFPIGTVDFNDMHQEQGIEAVRSLLLPDTPELYEPREEHIENKDPLRPLGALGHVYDYYNATSGNEQKGFAAHTALALGSVLLGRRYKTNFGNYTPLYYMCVGKTSTGKEHPKKVIEKILKKNPTAYKFLAGDGYTSGAAVASTLLHAPNHITITDEIGRYMEAAMGGFGGNAMIREANTALMEIWGRCDGTFRAKNYSTMTHTKKDAQELMNRLVEKPCITWMSMTTPSTLFASLDMKSVHDGFLNRFMICFSDAKRVKRKHKEMIDVPEVIIDWMDKVLSRNDVTNSGDEDVRQLIIPFTQEAYDVQDMFQDEILELQDKLELQGLEAMAARTNEQAMRIGLMMALSRNPLAEVVEAVDMEWGVKYARMILNSTLELMKFGMSNSEFDAHKKEFLTAIRKAGADGITNAQLGRLMPFSQHKPRYRKEVMDALKEADYIIDETYQPQGGGRPTLRWLALKDG